MLLAYHRCLTTIMLKNLFCNLIISASTYCGIGIAFFNYHFKCEMLLDVDNSNLPMNYMVSVRMISEIVLLS